MPIATELRRTSAARAVADIRSGDNVFVGSGAAEPQSLVEALTARHGDLRGVDVHLILTLGTAPYSHWSNGTNNTTASSARVPPTTHGNALLRTCSSGGTSASSWRIHVRRRHASGAMQRLGGGLA